MNEFEPLPHPLPDALVELIAQRFRVIGEPMRIRILDRLRGEAMTVNELTEALAATQQNISKHLGILHGAGVLGRKKEGNRVRYSIVDESVLRLCEEVCGGLRHQLAELDQLLAGGTA